MDAASQGWRLERRRAVLGAGLMLGGIANSMYYAQITVGTYVEGGLLDTVRPMSALVLALASVHGRGTRPLPRTPTLLLRLGLALVYLTILVIDHFRAIPTTAIALACCALIAVLGRALLAFRENEAMLSHSQVEALTDGLTNLPNRRALSQRLARVPTKAQPTTLLRIIAVCDAYDTMVTVRTYPGAVPTSDALRELRRCAGTQFEPRVVTAFTAMILSEPLTPSEPQPLSLSSRSMSST